MQTVDFGGVLNSLVFIYSNIFSNFSLESILTQIEIIMLIKTVYIIISSFLPIEGLANALFSPFSYLHQLFHAHAAKTLNKRNVAEGKSPFIRMTTSLGNTTIRSSEYSNISFMISNESNMTTRDVMYFANASSAPSFVALLLIVSVGPLMQEFWFAIIHFYILCGIVISLMPSKADSKLIINYIIIRTEISPWYVVNIFFVFLFTAGTYGLKYYYLNYFPPYWIVEPILMGIWSAVSYLLLFGLIIMFTTEKRIDNRKINYYMKDEKLTWTEEELTLLNELETNTQ